MWGGWPLPPLSPSRSNKTRFYCNFYCTVHTHSTIHRQSRRSINKFFNDSSGSSFAECPESMRAACVNNNEVSNNKNISEMKDINIPWFYYLCFVLLDFGKYKCRAGCTQYIPWRRRNTTTKKHNFCPFCQILFVLILMMLETSSHFAIDELLCKRLRHTHAQATTCKETTFCHSTRSFECWKQIQFMDLLIA